MGNRPLPYKYQKHKNAAQYVVNIDDESNIGIVLIVEVYDFHNPRCAHYDEHLQFGHVSDMEQQW